MKWINALNISMRLNELQDQQLQIFTAILKQDEQFQKDKQFIDDVLTSKKLEQINDSIGKMSLDEVHLKEEFQNFLVRANSQ